MKERKAITARPASESLKKQIQLKTIEFTADTVSDDDMDKINGGFRENRGGYANNCEIECPYCGETSINWIYAGTPDDRIKRDPYYCYSCGNWFEVDANNILYY